MMKWFMKKNAIVLLIVNFLSATSPKLYLSDVSSKNIAVLHQFAADNPGSFTVEVAGSSSYFSSIMQKLWACKDAFCSLPGRGMRFIGNKAFKMTCITLGLYIAINAFIKGIYSIVTRPISWSVTEKQKMQSDYGILQHKTEMFDVHMSASGSAYCTLKFLHFYKRLDNMLKQMKIRHYFLQNDACDVVINRYVDGYCYNNMY